MIITFMMEDPNFDVDEHEEEDRYLVFQIPSNSRQEQALITLCTSMDLDCYTLEQPIIRRRRSN